MALMNNILLAFAEGDPPWWDYPGFELWKFVNLAIFIIAALYLHRRFGRPVAEALRARKDSIARALVKARQERDNALQQLAEVEARLQGLEDEVAAIRQRSQAEAQAENERLKRATEAELAKLRENAKRDIEVASKAAANELRRFASEESIRLAERIITQEIKPEDDARLTRARAESLRGTAH